MRGNKLKKIKALMNAGESCRKQLYTDDVWMRFEDYWFSRYPQDESVLSVPVLVSDSQRQMAALLGGQPRIEVTTNVPGKLPAARVKAAYLNYLLGKLHFMDQLRDAVQDTITLGTGFLLDGFGSQYGVYIDTTIDGFDRSRYGNKNQRIEYHDYIDDDKPWSLRVHPSDIIIPPGTVRTAALREFFHRYIRPLEDVKGDDKLNRHRNEVTADAEYTAAYEKGGETARQKSGESEDVILYDHYDLKINHRTTFNESYPYALADDVDEIMIRIDRLPLHTIIFNHNSRFFWGTADFDFQEPLAQEINNIRTRQHALGQLQIAKGFYDKTKLEDEDDLQAFEKAIKDMTSDAVMALIGINGSPRDFIEQFTPTQVYDSIPQVEQCKKEIEQFGLGIGPLQKGLMSTGRHTKYETQSAEAYHDQSMSPRMEVIRNVILDVVRNWDRLIIDFQIEPVQVRTYDAAGNPVTVEFNGSDLEGDFDFKLSLDSMRVKGHNEKIEEANMILAQCMPFVQMGIIDPASLVKQYLSRLDSDWDIESLLMGQAAQGPAQSFGQFEQQFMGQMPQNNQSLGQLIGALNGQGAVA